MREIALAAIRDAARRYLPTLTREDADTLARVEAEVAAFLTPDEIEAVESEESE